MNLNRKISKLCSGLLLASLFGITAQADIIRVESGAGIWQNKTSQGANTVVLSGDPIYDLITNAVDGSSSDVSDTKSNPYMWIFFKHPVPLLPNFRLEYVSTESSETTSESVSYNGVSFGANTTSTLALTQYDAILYYNILDNTFWTTIDLGLDVKTIEGTFTATDSLNLLNTVSNTQMITFPMAYARGRIEVPGTNLGFEGNFKYAAFGDYKAMDYLVKTDYTLVNIFPVDVGFELGYRLQNLELSESSYGFNVTTQLQVDGLFAGAVVRF